MNKIKSIIYSLYILSKYCFIGLMSLIGAINVFLTFVLVFGCFLGHTNQIGLDCCEMIKRFGEYLGLGYFATNILIFVVVEPICIIAGFFGCFIIYYAKSQRTKKITLGIVALLGLLMNCLLLGIYACIPF